MGKVSIGLRGWRFDEDEVLADDGSLRPVDELPTDTRNRILRLSALVGSPCDACWLIHGDEHIDRCNVAAVVYGEPMAEIVLCSEHEADFLYWYREQDGVETAGSEEFQDAFHEWFLDGGRAPDDYGSLEHVETNPEAVPDTPPVTQKADSSPEPEDRIDLRDGDLSMDYPTE